MGLTLTDLFCGAGGSSTGAVQVPGVTARAASNHWQLAVDTHNTNHPDADHICADLSQIDPRYFPTTDILWASPECFAAGHLVMTSRGHVPIELVEVGDVVLTHENRWRPVTRVQARESEQLLTVRGQGHPGIVTTATHKFWARASARKWNNGIRQYRRAYQPAGWMEAHALADAQALWATPVEPESLPIMELPPVFASSDHGWWLLGRWLGDGSLSFGRNHEVTITCGFHESEDLGNVLAGTGVRWHRSDKRTATVFTAACAESRNWLVEQCGHGAAAKQTPAWALSLSIEERQALLDGYMSADGGTTQHRHRASTVSRALAVSMRLLAESLGHRVSMAYDQRTSYSIEGRAGVAKRQWIMHWEPGLHQTRSPEAFTQDGHAWSRVREVTPVPGTATVYNIEVAEDHSYVLDGIVVKNCTNHSIARGKKRSQDGMGPDLFGQGLPEEAAQRSRATMWDVPRFAESHRYQAVIVENVVDAANWTPFKAWLLSMDSLGYDHQIVYLNSMHAWALGPAAPQSRDRMYVVFWHKGNRRPDLEHMQRPPAVCPEHGRVAAMQSFKNPDRRWGRYRAQYVYRCPNVGCRNRIVEPDWVPAASVIDWTDLGTRIGDRARPLAEKTLRRIQAGIDRYWGQAQLVPVEGREGKTAQPVSGPVRTQTTRNETGLLVPLVVNNVSGADGSRSSTAREPLPTMVAGGLHASLLSPPMMHLEAAGNTYDAADPHHPAHGRGNGYYRVWDGAEPLRTMHTTASKGVAFPPFIAELRGGSSDARAVTDPLATDTASGNHHGLVTADYGKVTREDVFLGRWERWEPKPVSQERNRSVAEPIPSISVEDCSFRMLTPHEIQQAMAFPSEYQLLGNKREKVRMAGNAVTPPAARDLVGAVAASLN